MKQQQCKTISVTEAASTLGIGRNLAYTMVKEGKIPSLRLGGRIVVPVAALERFLDHAAA